MKSVTLFLFVAALTACLSYSSRTVIGADPKNAPERPLALNSKAIVDSCEVSGQLVRKEDGVYAVLDYHNPTEDEATVQFNLAVHCTPASSPMMRMLPMPSMIHRQHIDCRLAAGERKKIEILVKKEEKAKVTPSLAKNPLPSAKLELPGMNPASWSLAISREEIKGTPGWGASAPVAPSTTRVVLEKGLLVLTRVLVDEANGRS